MLRSAAAVRRSRELVTRGVRVSRMEKPSPKETINLLDLLSESDSDSTDLIIPPQKKKKVKRRSRSRVSSRDRHGDSCGCNKSDMRIVSLWLAAVLITFWLIALSWLAAILYGEIKKMDTSIKSGKCYFKQV